MSTDTTHAIPSPEVRQRADMYVRYYRTIPADDAISGLCLRLASAEILDNRHSRMLAEATAEREHLKAEVERMRPIVLAAIAWREWIAGRLVDLMHAGPEETALIAAVDKLTEGSGR